MASLLGTIVGGLVGLIILGFRAIVWSTVILFMGAVTGAVVWGIHAVSGWTGLAITGLALAAYAVVTGSGSMGDPTWAENEWTRAKITRDLANFLRRK